MAKKETYQDYEPGYEAGIDYLHDWVFHYNIYADNWAAIPRNKYDQYWTDYNLEGVIRSTSFNTLIEILHRTKGNASQLEKKINIKND